MQILCSESRQCNQRADHPSKGFVAAVREWLGDFLACKLSLVEIAVAGGAIRGPSGVFHVHISGASICLSSGLRLFGLCLLSLCRAICLCMVTQLLRHSPGTMRPRYIAPLLASSCSPSAE